MGTSIVYYPHAIYLGGAITIAQLSEVEPANNFQDLTEFAASEVGPQFTGTHMGAPDIRFSSTQIKDILDACSTAHGIVGDLSAQEVDLEYKAGANLGARVADATTSHLRMRLTNNAMLCWESITARQGALAEVRCRLATVFNSGSGSDPMVATSGVALGLDSAIAHLFTLGPIKLNGSFVEGVTEATLENNIEYEEVASEGDGFVTYVAIKRYRPVLTFRTRNAAVLSTYGTKGTALSALKFFLRKKLLSGINVSDATAENIGFTGTVGTIKARKISSPEAVAEVTVDLRQSAEGTACYAIDTTEAVA